MNKRGYTYIITNMQHGTLYVGVTSDIIKRMYEHKHKLFDGFSKKYNLKKLVYYDIFENIKDAISREKQLKNWHREWKINLIEKDNPEWKDLSLVFFNEEIESSNNK